MGDFRFKRFTVRNELSAMKVNTDGVILGASTPLSFSDRNILDVGTGTGTVALMLAQRTDDIHAPARITGIDIDAPSASEADANFAASPWGERLTAVNTSLQDYTPEVTFDLIVSNPPFYDDSLTNPDVRLTTARHSVSLSYREILLFAQMHLSKDGRVCMILPSEAEFHLLREARSHGLFLKSRLRVRTTPSKAEKRIVCEFSFDRNQIVRDEVLTIQDGGEYTRRYLDMMQDFYLFA